MDTVATRKLIYYGAWRERSVSKQQTTEWVAGKKWKETNKFLLVECHLRSAKISTKHIHAARGNDSVLKRVQLDIKDLLIRQQFEIASIFRNLETECMLFLI